LEVPRRGGARLQVPKWLPPWSTQRVSWSRLVQARAGLLVISEALTDHAAYFEAVAPDDEIRDLIPAAYDGL